VQEQAGASLPIVSDASYLVTGGTGGFGLETARWLVDNGARSLCSSPARARRRPRRKRR
jgi:phthiocerol/phenolphthiocerol synthesis type-I polyketide synthase C